MSLRSPFSHAVARLVPGVVSTTFGDRPEPPSRRPLYRPLVAGPAVLRQVEDRGSWLVTVSTDGLLRPLVPGTSAAVRRLVARQKQDGVRCRIALALVSPDDLLHASTAPRGHALGWSRRTRDTAPPLRIDIYGWSLMIQLPGMRGVAMIDANEAMDDLPAYYESPVELVDRANHLAARGVPSRPIAVVTRPEDFFGGRQDGGLRNRFHPRARFHRPCRLERLL